MRTNSGSDPRLIVALDVSSTAEALKIAGELGNLVPMYKVGMQLYTAEGPDIVRCLVGSGQEVFLDLKYHDIPNTVASAVHEAAQLGVSMLTVHASGGEKMLRAAVQAAPALKVVAVTVLTSMDANALNQTGVPGPVLDQVLHLGHIARQCGCAGVVSSAREAKSLRERIGEDFLIVTPGVRPTGSDRSDQARVVTPAEAIGAGATHLVVGRPITAAKDRAAAARLILEEMRNS